MAKRLKNDSSGLGKLISAVEMSSQMVGNALKTPTKYSCEGRLDLFFNAWQRSRASLIKDEKELQYLFDQIRSLEQKEITGLNFRDIVESWTSALKLRSKLHSECAQAIFNAIVADGKLLRALQAGQTFATTDCDPPSSLAGFISKT